MDTPLTGDNKVKVDSRTGLYSNEEKKGRKQSNGCCWLIMW